MVDKELVKLLKKGDEEAYKAIIFTYSRYVSTVIANQIRDFNNISAIEELSSDVFYELWKNRHSLKSFHLRGWLSAAARNKAKNYLRTQKISFESIDDDLVLISGGDVFDELEKKEKTKIVNQAVEGLKDNEREVIVRYYYYNQTVSRISSETEINIETVKSTLQRSRNKLKKILDKGGFFK